MTPLLDTAPDGLRDLAQLAAETEALGLHDQYVAAADFMPVLMAMTRTAAGPQAGGDRPS